MKKFTKIMLGLICVFLAVGIGFSAAGAAMGATGEDIADVKHGIYKVKDFMIWDGDWDFDWDDDDWDDDDDDTHHEAAASQSDGTRKYTVDPVQNIEIDLRYDELKLQTHSGEKILVEVENDSSENVKVKSGSDKLEIKSSKKKSGRCVTVSYPAGKKFTKLEISVGAGNVEINGDLSAEKLEMEMGAGEFTNSGSITVKELDVEVGTGSAELDSVTAEKINGECGIGALSLSVKGKEEDYDYGLECGIGAISIGNNSYSGLGREKDLTYPGASGKIELECGIGEIEITFE